MHENFSCAMKWHHSNFVFGACAQSYRSCKDSAKHNELFRCPCVYICGCQVQFIICETREYTEVLFRVSTMGITMLRRHVIEFTRNSRSVWSTQTGYDGRAIQRGWELQIQSDGSFAFCAAELSVIVFGVNSLGSVFKQVSWSIVPNESSEAFA